MKRFKLFGTAALCAAGLLLALEIGVRLTGALDSPTYALDSSIGYIVKPNQSGKFLRKNSWVFNDRCMGTYSPWKPEGRPNILLIGNSIVMGGNHYEQKDKLGPLIQQDLGDMFSVWPIGVGGWNVPNEAAYLERNPDVSNSATFFVWEYMTGGLSGLSRWCGDYVFPRQRPTVASWYVFRRYVLRRLVPDTNPTSAISPEASSRFAAAMAQLAAATRRTTPGILLLYPSKEEYLTAKRGGEWLPERPELVRIARFYGVELLDISQSPEWNENFYREGTHPTPQGNAVLGHILSVAIERVLSCEREHNGKPTDGDDHTADSAHRSDRSPVVAGLR